MKLTIFSINYHSFALVNEVTQLLQSQTNIKKYNEYKQLILLVIIMNYFIMNLRPKLLAYLIILNNFNRKNYSYIESN